MGVLRLVMIALLVLGLLWLARRLIGGGADRAPRGPRPGARQPGAADDGAPLMVACARCGVHLPAADALTGPAGPQGRVYYCCAAHRDSPSP